MENANGKRAGMPALQQVDAGKKRMEQLSSADRKSLASKAAHVRWTHGSVLVAVCEGEWNGMPCAVLEDGRRVLSERGLSTALSHIRAGQEYKKRSETVDEERLPVFIPDVVAKYLDTAARKRLASPIRYRKRGGFAIPAWGIEADLVPDICEAYLAARDAGELTSEALTRKAAAADKLLRGIAKVGIVALIDEATGYQVERDKDELQQLLKKYVAAEFHAYAPMFPTEFYAQLFRLHQINTADIRKRPAYFGGITNNIVYQRMLPGMLERLRKVNPANEEGLRPRKHHQHMVKDQGVSHLRDHLVAVVALMRAARTWKEFEESLDRAYPVQPSPAELDPPEGRHP